MSRFWIQLEPTPTGAYYPGQLVSGVVVLVSYGKNNILEGFHLEAKGRAKVKWSTDDVNHRAGECYFHSTLPVVASDSPIQGLHRLAFSFRLPVKIPPSYEGKHGYVRYTVRAVKESMWVLGRTLTCEIPFTVNATVDLNRNESAMLPVLQSVCKTKAGFNPRLIKADAWLDRKGYIPGETIHFNARIENCSGKTLRKSSVRLLQYVTYKDGKRQYTVKETLWQRSGGNIANEGIQVWDRLPISVPNVPPSGMPHCSLIDIQYIIKLIVDPGFFSKNLVLRLKILIGSLPSHMWLNIAAGKLGPPTSIQSLPGVGLISSPKCGNASKKVSAVEGHQTPPLSPPPAYEECESTRRDSVHADDNKNQQVADTYSERFLKLGDRLRRFASLIFG